MGTLFQRRLTRWQAESQREDLADLYREAHRDSSGTHLLDRAAFLSRLVDHDIQQPEFDMLAANDPTLVGCVYGYRADRGTAWWDTLVTVPGELDELTGSRQVFFVAELLVLPHQRRRGVATRLLTELLSRATAAVALTFLQPGNTTARAAYQSWGWSKAGEIVHHAGPPPLEAWARRLSR